MSKNTLILVLGGVLILASMGVGVFVVMRMGKSSIPEPSPNNPFGSSVLPGGQQTNPPITVKTVSGQSVAVPDFRVGHEPDQTPLGAIYTLRAPEYSNTETSFSVQYTEGSSEFLIMLLQEPIGETRREAERYLRAMLALQDADLCALNTLVVVMPSVNPTFATYENLGLSFCPGAVALP